MLSRAVVLGSGGAVPTDRRETSSLLLLSDDSDEAVVVDAGTGLRRLMTDPSLLEGRSSLTVLLTHFHPDHICGLPYLGQLSLACEIRGPAMALHGVATSDVLDRHFAAPVFPDGVRNVSDSLTGVSDYEEGEFDAGPFTVRARVQERHPGRTIGLRFGDDLVWCTDTEADPGAIEFARGARVLAHESWFPVHPGHTPPSAAGQIAADAGVERLVLIHVPPHITDDDVLREPAAALHDNVVVATDELELV